MNTQSRVLKTFIRAFDLEEPVETSELAYLEYPEWTSVGHMTLVAALEEEFDAMLETREILSMSNFDKAVEIMSRYDAG
ncbi:acyl carrier protein [Shinella zoogloeoides]|uniref:acyl carrier protein n=1 Tax=Shinella zoogloeoides TaxID=352475 RepID=UPI00299E89E3|nr:acyl carrier protein [Shinella zoogloeoides]WPE19144.1 hypothetical protein ShzoTeo12_03010 [Shinella zoogloeoides]